jgi:hypothetical protein
VKVVRNKIWSILSTTSLCRSRFFVEVESAGISMDQACMQIEIIAGSCEESGGL